MEPESASRARSGAFDRGWRARAQAAQEAAVPDGAVAVSAPAPLGVGGLGRHAGEIVDALLRTGRQASWLGERAGESPAGIGPGVDGPGWTARLAASLTRFSPAWQMWAACADFDRRAASALDGALEHVIAFSGAAANQFRRAQGLRSAAGERPSLGLVSATAHIDTVLRNHARAYRQYPLERSWAPRLRARLRYEYEHADRIYVSSRRVRASFEDAGVAASRLVDFPLTPDARYELAAGGEREASATFDVVYVGSLSVVKGVPLLVDAVARLAHGDLRLVLVGGWGTRGMRRFLERARSRDARVQVRLGDPLQWLDGASVYVHPSYDDGFAYAPAEALAAGVPLVVTDTTGMCELIDAGRTGAVVPSGDVDALAAAIDAAYRGQLLHA